MIKSCIEVSTVVKGFSEQLDVEKYYDVYDISDLDISDAMQGFTEAELEDAESLRMLKIAAARFHTLRRIFLCALLAFEATSDNTDFMRWSTAVEGLRTLNRITGDCYEKLRLILCEEDSKSSLETLAPSFWLTNDSVPYTLGLETATFTQP